ncbi:DMT family transporter [Marinactinospora rubrisoli]|uniref:DMT family transporter n=1 Tax=Marinactinospora rubrisoli TaxID=2715399 RepID=A0ABW2KC04_9ACTN
MTWAIVAGVAGALAFAAGAALQQRSVLHLSAGGTGQARLLLRLVRDPVWLTGTLLTGCGLAGHLLALSHAPLTIVQPIGVSGLLFAVLLSALFHRRRPLPAQIWGSLAITGGLVALLSALPFDPHEPEPSGRALVSLPVLAVAIMLACAWIARRAGDAARALMLAVAGGVGYAVTSALARIVGVDALAHPVSVLRPLTFVAIAMALIGAVVIQNAYRTDHFTLAYATLLISDPVAATVIGVLYLDEPLPSHPGAAAVAVLAAVLVGVGTGILARYSRPRAARTETGPPPSGAADRRAGDGARETEPVTR